MLIQTKSYKLDLKHTFNISYSSRKTTDDVLIKISDNKIDGYGEASLPPYYQETPNSVINFLSKIQLKEIDNIQQLKKVLEEIDLIEDNNTAAKASVDIALHDYLGKKLGKPVYELYQINKSTLPYTSFTIGIDQPDVLRKKISDAEEFHILKIKLGTNNDKGLIEIIRQETDKSLYVDVNQGWSDKYYALDMIYYLVSQNVLLVEQPMKVEMIEESSWLKERSPLPIIADEAVKRLVDIEKISNSYHGLNIKLMKCTGIHEAYKMIIKAKEMKLKVMLGCMTETSCAISAAMLLSPLADYADLDGNLLIANDPFHFTGIVDGKIVLSNKPGLGIQPKYELFK